MKKSAYKLQGLRDQKPEKRWAVDFEYTLKNDRLNLFYKLAGPWDEIESAESTKAIAIRPAQELWKNTVLEFFLADGKESYIEWNFSLSGQWDCIRFASYRKEDKHSIQWEREPISFESTVGGSFKIFNISLKPNSSEASEQFKVGMAASILKEKSGGEIFFAAAHNPKGADFHDSKNWLKL